MVDLAGGQQGAQLADRHLGKQRAEVGHVVVGVYGDDAFHLFGGRSVQLGDLGSCHRGAEEGDMERVDARDVVHELAVALDQRRVLATTHGAAHDTGRCHQVTSNQSGAGGSSPRIFAPAYSTARTML